LIHQNWESKDHEGTELFSLSGLRVIYVYIYIYMGIRVHTFESAVFADLHPHVNMSCHMCASHVNMSCLCVHMCCRHASFWFVGKSCLHAHIYTHACCVGGLRLFLVGFSCRRGNRFLGPVLRITSKSSWQVALFTSLFKLRLLLPRYPPSFCSCVCVCDCVCVCECVCMCVCRSHDEIKLKGQRDRQRERKTDGQTDRQIERQRG